MTDKERQTWEALRRWMIDYRAAAVEAIDALLDDESPEDAPQSTNAPPSMTEVKTYSPHWRASVSSTMMEYALRDSQPDLYVDYHDYKALEAELAEAVELLGEARQTLIDEGLREWPLPTRMDAFLDRQEAKHG